MKTELTLEEFVRSSNPIPDASYENHPMERLCEQHMEEATLAHLYAYQAFRNGKHRIAYWNALHAIGCYAAAHAAVTKDHKIDATAEATYAYMAALSRAEYEHPQLHWDYGNLKREADDIDWQDIRNKMEHIRSDIGELMDELGELGAETPENAGSYEYTGTKLGIIQNALGVADSMIIPAMPPENSGGEDNAQ